MTIINALGNSLSGQSGTGEFVGKTSPTLITPALGAASATSINFGGGALSTYIMSGAFTPTFIFASAGDLSVSYTSQIGFYNKIGKVVFFNAQVECTITYTTSSSSALIAGLPFLSNGNNPGQPISGYFFYPLAYESGYNFFCGYITNTSAGVALGIYNSGKPSSVLAKAYIPTGATIKINLSGKYFTNN